MRTCFSISSLFTLAALSMLAQSATASDTYSTSTSTGTGILSISKVAVGDTLYSGVKATIGYVVGVGTTASVSTTYLRFLSYEDTCCGPFILFSVGRMWRRS